MDEEREQGIEADAKRIMDNFLAALEKADLPEAPLGIEREASVREPEAADEDALFPKKMFGNAPKAKDGYIMAEKKSW